MAFLRLSSQIAYTQIKSIRKQISELPDHIQGKKLSPQLKTGTPWQCVKLEEYELLQLKQAEQWAFALEAFQILCVSHNLC